MVLPRGNKDPNFDPDNVDPEAFKKTASRTAVVWGALGSIVYLVTSSGKEFNQMNAPGYAEQAKRTAEGKAAYLKELKDREAALAECRTARDLDPTDGEILALERSLSAEPPRK